MNMNMNTLKATYGNWLFNGDGFAKQVCGKSNCYAINSSLTVTIPAAA